MRDSDTRERSWEMSIACARIAAGLDAPSHAIGIAGVADWQSVVEMAREQGLLAWLSRALEHAGLSGQEHAVRAATVSDVGRALSQIRLLGRLTRAFGEAGVPMLPYKGPALSLQLYGDAAMRSSADLDIVVAREDYARARDILITHGLPSRHGYSPRREQALFSWLGHASFGRGRDEFVELHWRFAPSQFAFSLEPHVALARSSSVMLGGARLPQMHEDDLLVTLAMHGARHIYERLEWLSGVTLLLHTVRTPPAVLVRHATALRARRMLLASVVVAHRVLGLQLSDAWNNELRRDPGASPVGEELARHVVEHGRANAPAMGGAALQLLYGRLADSRRNRWRVLVRAVMMPTEREAELLYLPDALTPLYYVIRPVRLIARYIGRSLGTRGASTASGA